MDLNNLVNAANLKLDKQKEGYSQEFLEDIDNEQDYSFEDIDPYGDIQVNYPETEEEQDISEIENKDDLLYPGGPTITQVEIWKKQFTSEMLFHVQIMYKHFVCRTLNRFEYKQIAALENTNALQREEIICRTCVLYPTEYNFKTQAKDSAGYPSTLSQVIMENSGFTKDYSIEVL